MEVIAYTKADHENFPGRVEILWQLYLEQYIAMAPEKKNKCQDIYQCGYYINETYNWGFTGDAAGTGGYYHYYGSSYTYQYRCIWLYTTCRSTITFNNSSSSSSSSSSTSTTTYADPYLYDNIDPSKLLENKVFKCLYQKFMEGNYSLFNNTIRAFEPLKDVTLVFEPLSNGNDGETDLSKIDEGIITIRINPTKQYSPIDWAETILHEGLHATIGAYIARIPGIDYSILRQDRLSSLYDYYFQQKKYTDPNFPDHAYMAEFYIEPAAKVLRSLDNNRYPLDNYYGIVYEGIEWFMTYNYPIRSKYEPYKEYNSKIRSNTSLCQ